MQTHIEFEDNCDYEASASRKVKSISGNGKPETVSLYPNPNNGLMTLYYQLNSKAQLHIYDVSGRELSKFDLDVNTNTLNLHLNLAQGIYFYSVTKDNTSVIKTDKLIILK